MVAIMDRKEGDDVSLKILRSETPYILITPKEFEIHEGIMISSCCTWKGIEIYTQSLPNIYSVINILKDATHLLEEEAMR